MIDVYDGDTVTLEVDLGFNVRLTERFRLYGINAPEVRGPERERGLESADCLRNWCEGEEIEVETLKDRKGKYGRYLAILWHEGVNLNDRLVEEGLAEYREY